MTIYDRHLNTNRRRACIAAFLGSSQVKGRQCYPEGADFVQLYHLYNAELHDDFPAGVSRPRRRRVVAFSRVGLG